MMPNKYNTRAKRLQLDNLIRERAWVSFQNSFSQLSAQKHQHDAARSRRGDGDGDAKRRGDATLCEAIIQCRNCQTTHRTLLHSLCDITPDSSPPPPEVIHLVASACPRSLLLHESGNEGTPLHLAIVQGASLDTIKALLEAAEQDELLNEENLLLALDSKGQTPLLLAVRCGIDEDTVKYLANRDVDGSSLLMSCDKKSKKNQSHVTVPLKYVASSESYFVGEGLEDQDLLRFMIVRTYHAKLKNTFPLVYYNSGGHGSKNQEHNSQTNSTIDIDGDTCLLQATIFCHELIGSTKVASSILSYIIRNGLFQRERLDSRTDCAGNLTLHIACLSDTTKFDQVLRLGDRESDYGLNSEDCTLLQYLINANPYPFNSPYLSKNVDGEVPLHCAIQSGKDWSQIQLLIDACPSSMQCCTSKGELPLHLAIKYGNPTHEITKLWNYYPEAASSVDGPTGLYPFQLAAIFGGKKRSRKGKSRKKTKSIECVHTVDNWDETSLSFFMLRECPSLFSSSLLQA